MKQTDDNAITGMLRDGFLPFDGHTELFSLAAYPLHAMIRSFYNISVSSPNDVNKFRSRLRFTVSKV